MTKIVVQWCVTTGKCVTYFRCITMLAFVKMRTVPCAEQVVMGCFVVVVVVVGVLKTSNGRNSDSRIIGSSLLIFDWPSAVLTLFLSRNANLLRASRRVARERTRTGLSSFSFSLRMKVSAYRHMSALDSL